MKRIDPLQTERARAFRKNATEAERKVWQMLSRFRPKFTRQLPIGLYIVDLACREAKLVVELDGSQHIDNKEYDDRRTRGSKTMGGPSSASGTAKLARIRKA